ncbi:MAG: PaaI family thioesterase [Candidatus Acidiferrales bacterium]
MSMHLERLEKMIRGEVQPPPIAHLIGFRLTQIQKGEATVEFDASNKHANPMGTLHGGVLCDVADAAMGIAFASTLDDGESFTTLGLKINFLRPVWNEKLRAVGKVVSRGKTVGMTECEITNSAGAMVARSSSTCMVLRGERAVGR